MKEYKEGTKVVFNIQYKGKRHGKDVILEKDCSAATIEGMVKDWFYEVFGEDAELPKETKMIIPPGDKKTKFPKPMPEWFTVNGVTIKKPQLNWRWDIP